MRSRVIGKTQILGLVLSILLVAFILELVRRRQLKEEYSLLWLLIGGLMFGVVLWKDLQTLIANSVGILYPPSALFLLGLLFVIMLLIHFSTVISRLAEQNKELAQKIALLENEVEKK